MAKMSKHAVIAGGTGFIGSRLQFLLSKHGYEITTISRMPGLKRITWHDLEQSGLPKGTTAIVNLAGQNVLDPTRRWTPGFKQNVWNSRINSASTLVQAISNASNVDSFINISGVSHYEPDNKVYSELDQVKGYDFMSKLCIEWERAATITPEVVCRNACDNAKVPKNWSYNEGKALISVYKNRKDEYFRTRNKKVFWRNVLTDLEALDVLISPTTADQVEIKWRAMYRAYKSAKDRGTGSSTSRFLYFIEMDELFKKDPVICSPHSVSVGVSDPEPAPMRMNNKSQDTAKNSRQKQTYLDIKKTYYEAKITEKKLKRDLLANYLEKKEKAKDERHRELIKVLQNKN